MKKFPIGLIGGSLLLLLFASLVYAAEKTGTTGAQFLKIGFGAKFKVGEPVDEDKLMIGALQSLLGPHQIQEIAIERDVSVEVSALLEDNTYLDLQIEKLLT